MNVYTDLKDVTQSEIELAKNIAIIQLSEAGSLVDDLLDCIEKVENNTQPGRDVFKSQVDYIYSNLHDYVDIIKKPMDLTTLKNNLKFGEYMYFFEFLRDSSLIWKNCRQYNCNTAQEYVRMANECETYIVGEMIKIPVFKKAFTKKIYDIIVTPEFDVLLKAKLPQIFSSPLEYSVADLHVIYKKLQLLPETKAMECIIWYMTKKNGEDWEPVKKVEINEAGEETVKYEPLEIKFNCEKDAQLLSEWENFIELKIIEQNNKPLPERKKRGPVPGSSNNKK